MKFLKLFFVFLFPLLTAKESELTTSVIIPCYYQHAKHLQKLVEELSLQTTLPDEVVISISEANKLPQEFINGLEEISWPFKLVIKKTNQKKWAGENRNIAALASTGDLIICQDADDLPHPQRIAILKQHFEEFEIDHLIHFCFQPKTDESLGAFSEVYREHQFDPSRYIHRKSTNDINKFLKTTQFSRSLQRVTHLRGGKYRIHFGNCAIRRTLFEKVKWGSQPRGQDLHFCKRACIKVNKTYILNLPLVFYIKERTSLQYRKH